MRHSRYQAWEIDDIPRLMTNALAVVGAIAATLTGLLTIVVLSFIAIRFLVHMAGWM